LVVPASLAGREWSCGRLVSAKEDGVASVLRSPSIDDAGALGEVHVAAWQAAYRGLMPDAYLDGLRVEERTQWWVEVLSRPQRDADVLQVADLDGQVRGFVLAGPARDDDTDGPGEVYALNVHPAAWGSGLGSALLAIAQTGLATAGFEHAVLWVLPGNVRARRLYEHAGWRGDGARRVEQIHEVQVEEVRYRRTLPAG
jgi:ribosomal protein S18 acetylase RimI-like enzyme